MFSCAVTLSSDCSLRNVIIQSFGNKGEQTESINYYVNIDKCSIILLFLISNLNLHLHQIPYRYRNGF